MGITKNVILFPFMAQGHLIPFMQLAQLIDRRKGYSVTIINTPSNIHTLRSSLPSTSSVHLVDLTPFDPNPHDHTSENTDAITHDEFFRFLQSSESLRPALSRFLSDVIGADRTHPPCLITDAVLGWTVQVVEELGVFHAFFLTSGVYGSAIFHSLLDAREIEKVLRERGREMRRKAREIGKVLKEAVGEGGASVRAMDEFLVKAFS